MLEWFKTGEIIVLQHHATKEIVIGQVSEDFHNRLGASALLKINNIKGLAIEEGTFNTNIWKIVGDKSFSVDGESVFLLQIIRELLTQRDIARGRA